MSQTPQPSTPAKPTAAALAPAPLPMPPALKRPRPWWRRRRTLLAVAALLAIGVLAVGFAVRPGQPVAPSAEQPAAAAAPRLMARGLVRPLAQARVGTVNGGVLDRLSVNVGDKVPAATELAVVRPRSDAPVEVLTAPFDGTVLALPASVGDTLAPGATVAVVGDVRRLQVETTDLDEFLVSRVAPGGRVTLTIPALDNRQLRGIVRSVALRPEPGAGSTESDTYPTVVDITDAIPPDLRVGMRVRLAFDSPADR
jgi:multidrug resistance efflux pump